MSCGKIQNLHQTKLLCTIYIIYYFYDPKPLNVATMKYHAEVYVMPLPELLDPQGKAVLESLDSKVSKGFEDVRIGKRIELKLEADSQESADKMVVEACEGMLYNPVMETYTYTLSPQD